MQYAPLQIMSSYSLLQSTISISELIKVAKERGYRTLTLTDHNVMYGAVEFYNQCLQNDIRPIIGLTLSLNGFIQDTTNFDVVLLAANNEGYRHLLQISTAKMVHGEQPLLWSEIQDQLGGLYFISPLNGEIRSLVQLDRLDDAKRYCKMIQEQSHLKGAFLGINASDDKPLLAQLTSLSKNGGLPLVAIDPVRYLNPEDDFAYHVLSAIDDGEKMVSPVQESHRIGNQWLKPLDKITDEFARQQLSEAVQQSGTLADQCHVVIEKKPTQLPHFQNKQNLTSKQYLAKLCHKGLKQRLARLEVTEAVRQKYQQRLEHELTVIDEMGFDDYFLIVWDVINYAHQVNIMTGPGRGSAAGSLVSYTLFITDVDPIHYDLLFERFLNPERAQMPDIDLDIPDDKRDIILKYVHDQYGDDKVAQIITFGTFGAKQSLRDVGRVFGITTQQSNQISKAVPGDTLHITLKEAYQRSQPLRNLLQDDPLNQLIFQTAGQIEGLPRHFGTHAAGLILSAVPLVEMTPLQPGNDDMLMTQYSKNYVEEVGLLKIDFLGLRNLSTLANIVDIIHQHANPAFDIHQIDLNDSATLALFQHGDTNGVFQFESSGIKRVLRDLHPDSFDMVAAVDALYRPGPMQNIDTFIKRKHGQEPIIYPAPELKPILAPTFGIIVYQEQVMQVASIMGGFSLGQADILRRAMSKKKHAVMDSMRTQFIAGAQQKGFSAAVANKTFDYIDQFASYGFNKSHAVAYSKMAFQLAYLKVHYSMAFFTSILNSVLGNDNKLRIYVQEIKKRQIALMKPDLNVSERSFSILNHQLYFGFNAIRGLRSDFITAILNERTAHGPFQSLEQFLQRIDDQFRKVKLIQPLINSGAMDCFGYHRSELTASLAEFIESISLSGNSIELIQVLKPKLVKLNEWNTTELMSREKTTLGVYLSKHPLEQYNDLRTRYHAMDISQLTDENMAVTMVLYVDRIKKIRTKKGTNMAFVGASDENGELDLVLFPKIYQTVEQWLHDKMVVIIKGKAETDRGLQIIVDQMQPAANIQHRLKQAAPHYCYLRLDTDHEQTPLKRQLYQFIQQNTGQYRIIIYQPSNDSKKLLEDQYRLNNDLYTVKRLKVLLGEKNVIFK